MKIILIPHLPTLYGRRYNLAKSLADQGHEVHFIIWDTPYPLTPKTAFSHTKNSLKTKTYNDNNSKNLHIHQVRRLPFFWPIINGILFRNQIERIYHKQQADLVISQAFTNETEAPSRLPLIYDINDDHQAFADIYGSPVYRLGYKLLGVKSVIARQSRNAILVTVVSDKLAAFAKQYNNNVLKIPNGVDSEAIRFSRKKLKTKAHSLVYVSTFGKWSRLNEVIETIDGLRKTYPDIHLNLIGDGTELNEAKDQVLRLGLNEYIKFYGKISNRAEIFRLISQAEICLNTSEKNHFRDAASPLKVLEYSAFGKKIVSSNLDEVEKLKFANLFIYADATGSKGLRKALIKAFANDLDASLVQKKIKDNYTWDVLTKELLNSLGKLKLGDD